MRLLIYHKITISIVAAFLFIATIFLVIDTGFQERRIKTVQGKIELLLRTLIERDSQPLANEIFERRIRAIKLRLEEMKSTQGVELISVYDHDGLPLYIVGSEILSNNLPPAIMEMSLEKPHIEKTTYEDRTVLSYTESIKAIGDLIGYISIYYTLEDIEEERMTSITLIFLQMATLLLGLFLILQLFLDRFVIKRLKIFRDGFKSVEEGHIDTKVIIKGDDELAQMAEAFNRMTMERARAESEMNKLRNYLQNIVNSMPSVLIGIDKDGIITQWNQKACDITGKSIDEALGNPLEKVYPYLSREMDQVKQAIRDREVKQRIKVPKRVDGENRYEDITVFPLIANGVQGAVIRIDDVTDKIRIEEMMVQSEKMLSVGGLAAGMAHEINNPLAGMIQTAGVLSKRLSDKSAVQTNIDAAEEAGTTVEAVSKYMEIRGVPAMIEKIFDSGKRVSSIVENMLSFARKSGGRFSTHQMADLLDRTLELAATDYDLKKNFDFRHIEIVREYEPDLPSIPCEETKIQQVILNILRNGAQILQSAKKENPRITVRLSRDPSETMLAIEIIDNGPGMPEQVRRRIFEPFFTTKSEGAGTGLGLSVSYFIVTENHGGEMTVRSSPGEGAHFTIKLPIDNN